MLVRNLTYRSPLAPLLAVGTTVSVVLSPTHAGCRAPESDPPSAAADDEGYTRPDPTPMQSAHPPVEPPGVPSNLSRTAWDGVEGESTWQRVVFSDNVLAVRTSEAQQTLRLAAFEGPACLGYPNCLLWQGAGGPEAVRFAWTDGATLRFLQCATLPPASSGLPRDAGAIARASQAELRWTDGETFCLDFNTEHYRRVRTEPVDAELARSPR